MRTIKSDTWDSGNHLTQFHEVIRDCETCHAEKTKNIEVCCVCPIHIRDRLIEKLAQKVRLYHEKYGTEYLGGSPYQILQKEAAEIGLKI